MTPHEAVPAGRDTGDRRLLKYSVRWLRPYRGMVVLALAVLMVGAAAELSLAFALRGIIDGLTGQDSGSFRPYIRLLVAIGVVVAAAHFLRTYLVNWLAERTVADLRVELFDHIVRLSPSFFETAKTAEVISRLVVDTALLQTLLVATVPAVLQGIVLVLGSALLMGLSSWKLSLIVVALLPLFYLPARRIGRRLRDLSSIAQDRLGKVGSAANESLRAVATVQAFNHETLDSRQVAEGVEDAFRAARRRFFWEALLGTLTILLAVSLLTIVLAVGSQQVVTGNLSVGELTAFLVYAVIGAAALAGLSGGWAQAKRAAGALERVLELLDVEPPARTPTETEPLPEPSSGSIVFQDVTFRYPSRPETPALDRFSFTVASGETLALVGSSGAGKSTVFNLLLRFYDIESGRILFDGVDISKVSPRELRTRIAPVAQEPDLFSMTVAENILYGFPDAQMQQAVEAAEAASARDFVERLPDGFDTHLGERGVQLSGGQRQRLAIARALIRSSARVLLFDEATSALDSESESRIQEALMRVASRKTLIVIAHRLATVRMADRIVVMDQGRIVGLGTHEELLQTCELYGRLARQQFGFGHGGTDHDPQEWEFD